jgi:RNA 3'-terminal phosphate cyclase (ATP)
LTTTLKLRGGTNAIQAPQIDYTTQIFLPFLKRLWDIDIDLKIQKRGYWPKGGGEIQVAIPALTRSLAPINLTERGKVIAIHGYSYSAGLPESLAKSMATAATSYLVEHAASLGYSESSISICSRRELPAVAVGSGSGVVLWAETENGCILGGSAVGKKGKDPHKVGQEAAEELRRNLEHGGCVDEYLQVFRTKSVVIIPN